MSHKKWQREKASVMTKSYKGWREYIFLQCSLEPFFSGCNCQTAADNRTDFAKVVQKGVNRGSACFITFRCQSSFLATLFLSMQFKVAQYTERGKDKIKPYSYSVCSLAELFNTGSTNRLDGYGLRNMDNTNPVTHETACDS